MSTAEHRASETAGRRTYVPRHSTSRTPVEPARPRRGPTSLTVVVSLVAGTLAAGTAFGAGAAQAAVGPSWANDCRTPLVFVSQGGDGPGTQLYTQQYTDTGGNFLPRGTNNLDEKYNSIGFNPIDSYIYAVGANGLVKIDSTGTLTDVGQLQGTGGVAAGGNHGAFDPAGNFYFGAGQTIFKLTAAQIAGANNPAATLTAQVLSPTGAAEGGSDYTYADGALWAAGPDGTVWKTDLGSLVTTAYPNIVKKITSVSQNAYGAAWTYGNGTLGFDSNAGDSSTGLAVQTVDISTGTPVFVRQVSGPGSGNNDGTSCSLPADLSLTKTINNTATSAANRLSVAPGGAVTWTIGVKNAGPGGSSQQFVTDTIPAGVTGVSVTAANAQCGVNGGALSTCSTVHPTAGQTLAVQFGYLPSDAGSNTRSITLTATAPPGVSTVFDNTATVDGNEADTTQDNTATAYATTPVPSFTLTKTGLDSRTLSASSARVGDEIQYSFTAQNTSSVVLTNLVINDPKVGGASCDSTAIAPVGQAGNSVVCNARYTVTQADYDAGVIHNVATATASAPGGTTVNAGPATFDVTTEAPASSIALTKTATPTTGAVLGTNVGYAFAVKNTGTVSLSAVTVTDPMFPAGITCPLAAPLVPGASVPCSGATHVVTQADFDAGTLINTATANATAVRGAAPAPSTASATVTMAAATNVIMLVKTGTDVRTGTAAGALPGDKVSYTFVITNNSNVTLTGAAIADSLIDNAATCTVPAGGVAPGGTVTCTAPSSYTVTQNDVDAGSAVNTATATGTFARGPQVTATSSAVVTAAVPANSVTLSKSVLDDRTGTNTGARVGDTLSYTFVVTNTGNTSLTGAAIADPLLPAGSITCSAVPAGGVLPGGTLTCAAPASHTVTQADVDAGTIPNTATVTAAFRRGDPATASASAVATAEAAAPSVTLTKTGTDDRTTTASGARVGDTLSYAFTVLNSGNVSLTTASLADPLLAAGAITCAAIPGGKLEPGQSITCSAPAAYTMTQPDVDRGSISNTATVTATFTRGANQTDDASAVVTAEPAVTAITLTKTATDDRTATNSGARTGDTVSYGFHVVNDANVSLATVAVTDPLLGAGAVTCPAIPGGKLAPGASIDCTATSAHTITQAEFDAGLSTNTASVDATFVRGAAATDDDTANVTAADPTPALSMVKAATVDPASRQTAALAGDSITYSFVVTNTGDISVDTLSILDVDPNVGLITCAALPDGPGGDRLAPGSSVSCAATTPHVITQREFDAQASLVNTASAVGRPLRGAQTTVTSPEATATVTLGAPTPGLGLVKTGTVTPTTDQDGVKVGDTVGYSYVVTNTGTVTMYDVDITDPHVGLGPITCPDTSVRPSGTDDGNGLAPGDSLTCTTAADGYTVTQADVDYGYVYDQATPTGYYLPGDPGTPFSGPPAEFTLVAAPAAPSIGLVKSAAVTPTDDQDGAFAGDTIAYSFLVTNTGNITVRDVSIEDLDPTVGKITCPDVKAPGIAPAGTTTCTADVPRTVTQAEFDLQAPLVNTATASAQPLRGPDTAPLPIKEVRAAFPQLAPPAPTLPARVVSAPSSATVPLGKPVAGLVIVKTATIAPASDQKAFKKGDRATFTFAVTNTGNVTMTDIVVADPKAGAVTCPSNTLAPGATVICAADEPHVFTQADVDNGSYTNSAVATGTPPPNTDLPKTPSVPDTVTVTSEKADPSITLVKTAHVSPSSHQGAARPGDTIGYTFLVTNTGNVTLTDVGVDDPTGGPVTCPRATLAPGESMTCRTDRTHTVTASEAGTDFVNRATAFGTPPQGMRRVSSSTATATVTVAEPPVTPTSTGTTAMTGVDAAGMVGSGILCLLLGALMLLVGLRRREGGV